MCCDLQGIKVSLYIFLIAQIVRSVMFFGLATIKADIVLISFGLLYLFIAILGFATCCTHKYKLIFVFLVLSCMVFFASLSYMVVSGVSAITADEAQQVELDAMKKLYDDFTGKQLPQEHEYATLQRRKHCCGFEGPKDYGNPIIFPRSCCPWIEIEGHYCSTDEVFKYGCAYTVNDEVILYYGFQFFAFLTTFPIGMFIVCLTLRYFAILRSMSTAEPEEEPQEPKASTATTT